MNLNTAPIYPPYPLGQLARPLGSAPMAVIDWRAIGAALAHWRTQQKETTQ